MRIKYYLRGGLVRWLEKYKFSEDQLFFILTLVCGVLSGFMAVGISKAVHGIAEFLRPNGEFGLQAFGCGLVFVFISGYITTRWEPSTSGSGIPLIRIWLVARNGYISLRQWLLKLVTTLLSLGSGMSLGREGPTVAICAGIGSTLATMFHLSKRNTKALVAIGSAGGLAAAFNTPIAAVIFTLEEIVGDLNHQRMLGQIIIASVIASLIAAALNGQQATFTSFEYGLNDSRELFVYLALGLLAAGLGPLWSSSVLKYRETLKKIFKGHRLSIMVVSFMLIGLLGMINPLILGSGHATVNETLLSLVVDYKVLLILFSLKFLATTISYGCGISGGLFMPTLFMGAMLGGATGAIAQYFFPDVVHSVGAYSLVGMGAFFASVIRAPFTSILIIFEMTHDYKIILPLMLANITSYLLAGKFSKKSIYSLLAEQDGMHLPESDDDILDSLIVEDAMVKDVKFFRWDDSIELAIDTIRNCEESITGYPVMKGGKIFGFISVKEILGYQRNNPECTKLVGDICIRGVVGVYPDQSLLVAFHMIQKKHITRVLVISRLDDQELLGLITAEDIVSKFGYHLEEDDK